MPMMRKQCSYLTKGNYIPQLRWNDDGDGSNKATGIGRYITR